jgi:hypothetical protein
VEIIIGIKHVPRELTVQSPQSAEDLRAAVEAALAQPDGVLSLTDEHDRTTMVPVSAIGFVQIAPEGLRRVGFGAL